MTFLYCVLQVDALFELIKGLIKDFDGLTDNDEVLNHFLSILIVFVFIIF